MMNRRVLNPPDYMRGTNGFTGSGNAQSEVAYPLPACAVSRYAGEPSESIATGKPDMTRADAIARAHQHLHSGDFITELERRVAYRTESQNAGRRDVLRAYLEKEMQPAFSKLDFTTRLIESPSRKASLSARGISRERVGADRADVRAWRRRRRHGRRMAGQSRSVADHDRGQPGLWPRHRR